jgi:aralkylamine N-acetyltransferase
MLRYLFLHAPDARQLVQIRSLYEQQLWLEPADEANLVERIVRGSHCFAVACEGDEIVGMGRAISDRASDAYIQDVTVHPDARGRGIASGLVAAIVARLHEDGLTWIGLIAAGGSRRLYEKLGFAAMADATPMLHRWP